MVKNSPANAADVGDVDLIHGLGDVDLIHGLGGSPGEGNVYPLQYSCLENPMDRGAWWTTGHRVAKRQT